MAFIEINGAKLYYETYGRDHPGKAPILLIHGSTITGQEDWSSLAPLLARKTKVIVPDCRGHGQSSNPHMTYSFKELADDMAALIRALGYERAHVIGHSNGGNVALVVLVEHPEVVQTAIPQAANAYVSQDLIDVEPGKFDPERVKREAPRWMEDMIRLHGPTHGPDYWRDLLRLTVHEIITEPNYTPERLMHVTRPTLIIQGADDPVNAPAGHGEWMARHIPFAELWQPAGIKHNVHLDVPLEWIRKVEDFIERRGTDAGEALYRLQRTRFADERDGMFQVSVSGDHPLRLSGQTLTDAQRQAAIERAQQAAGQEVDATQLKALLTPASPFALVNRTVTDLRREPRMLAERVSHGLLGEAARVLDERNDWALIRMEHDGYVGWVNRAALHICSEQDVQTYQNACQYRVLSQLLPAFLSPQEDGAERAGTIAFGTRVAVETLQDDKALLRLPDGRRWWVVQKGLLSFEESPSYKDPDGIEETLRLIQRLIGVPYLWGGRTPFGYDCSGLAGTFYAFMGVTIPRDADQQYRSGIPVSGSAMPGDLLFFGEPSGSQRVQGITHVAIALSAEEMIHANGSAWGVSYNSLNPQAANYREWLKVNLVGIRRFCA
jgi:pimeloyl-ACP methyl ester carboxylesterase/cell wall-associated NlpC family hydrolase